MKIHEITFIAILIAILSSPISSHCTIWRQDNAWYCQQTATVKGESEVKLCVKKRYGLATGKSQ